MTAYYAVHKTPQLQQRVLKRISHVVALCSKHNRAPGLRTTIYTIYVIRKTKCLTVQTMGLKELAMSKKKSKFEESLKLQYQTK